MDGGPLLAFVRVTPGAGNDHYKVARSVSDTGEAVGSVEGHLWSQDGQLACSGSFQVCLQGTVARATVGETRARVAMGRRSEPRISVYWGDEREDCQADRHSQLGHWWRVGPQDAKVYLSASVTKEG